MQEIRHESQPEYCKLNQNRKPEFRTGTYICKVNQRKVVKRLLFIQLHRRISKNNCS